MFDNFHVHNISVNVSLQTPSSKNSDYNISDGKLRAFHSIFSRMFVLKDVLVASHEENACSL